MTKTKIVAEAMLMRSMTETGKPYQTPEQLSGNIEKHVRNEKEATKDLRAEFFQQVSHSMPDATP